MSHQTNVQRGGILITNETVDADFMEFLSNSTLAYLTEGADGVVFVATVKRGYVSKYKYMTPSNYGEPVTSIIVKFLIKGTPPEIMRNEVNIQRNIFLKTVDYLTPICPAIVYAGHIDTLVKVKSVAKILLTKSTTGLFEIINTLRLLGLKYAPTNPSLRPVSMDIIGMEFAANSQILHTLYNTSKINTGDIDKYRSYYYKGLFALLKLAMDTGMSQGDFHMGNILIDPGDVDYFDGSPGRAIVIDFGFALKIPDSILAAMRADVVAGQYTRALKQLCVVGRNDDLKMTNYRHYYGWACGLSNYRDIQKNTDDFEAGVNEALTNLIDAYDRAREVRISLFKKNNKTDPARYPILPLSADVKKNIYAGFYPRNPTAAAPVVHNIRIRSERETPRLAGVSEVRTKKPKKTPELKKCPEGSVRNPKTRRCRKGDGLERAKKTPELKKCPEGSVRNPETRRCRKTQGVSGKKSRPP